MGIGAEVGEEEGSHLRMLRSSDGEVLVRKWWHAWDPMPLPLQGGVAPTVCLTVDLELDCTDGVGRLWGVARGQSGNGGMPCHPTVHWGGHSVCTLLVKTGGGPNTRRALAIAMWGQGGSLRQASGQELGPVSGDPPEPPTQVAALAGLVALWCRRDTACSLPGCLALRCGAEGQT